MIRTIALSLMAITLATGLLVPTSAQAAVISENLSFNLTDFVDVSGNNVAPPSNDVTGYITVTYDPTLTYDNDTTDIVVHSLTGVTVDSPLGFTYTNGYLEFGGTANDSDYIYSNTNDIVVAFNVSNPSDPTFIPCSTPGYVCGSYTGSDQVDAAGYAIAGSYSAWFYGVQSTVSPNPPAPSAGTPEPASIALFGCGLVGALTAARYRGKKAAA